jgi:hypothetical protein
MIYTLGAGVGLAPVKTIDAELESSGQEPSKGNVLRLMPNTKG